MIKAAMARGASLRKLVLRVNLRALFDELFRLLLHAGLERVLLGDAVLGGDCLDGPLRYNARLIVSMSL